MGKVWHSGEFGGEEGGLAGSDEIFARQLCGQTSWQMSQPNKRAVFWICLAIVGGILPLFSMVW